MNESIFWWTNSPSKTCIRFESSWARRKWAAERRAQKPKAERSENYCIRLSVIASRKSHRLLSYFPPFTCGRCRRIDFPPPQRLNQGQTGKSLGLHFQLLCVITEVIMINRVSRGDWRIARIELESFTGGVFKLNEPRGYHARRSGSNPTQVGDAAGLMRARFSSS